MIKKKKIYIFQYFISYNTVKSNETSKSFRNFSKHDKINFTNGLTQYNTVIKLLSSCFSKYFRVTSHIIDKNSNIWMDYYWILFGFQEIAHKWLCNFITNKTQYVSLKGFNSKRNVLNFGVPQGSILGLILFLIDINANVTETRYYFICRWY